MNIACKDSRGREAVLSVNVDGTDGIRLEVVEHDVVTIVYIDTNNARSLQFAVKACRMGAEARAVAK